MFFKNTIGFLVITIAGWCIVSPTRSCLGEDRKQAPIKKCKCNSLKMRFVYIPPGEFLMGGSDSDKNARANELPQHPVRISRGFYIGAYEVTVGEFRAFVKATGHKTAAEEKGSSGFDSDTKTFQYNRRGFNWKNVGWKQSKDHPVVNVNWHDADAFCKWLSKKEGRTYRLPTEAEWEYACRAGTKGRFITGDSIEDLQQIANVQDKSLFMLNPRFSNSEHSTYLKKPVPWNDHHPFAAPVGRFKANDFRLHDTLGNVAEWCNDWYAKDYYQSSPKVDPTGPTEGKGRVIRGGAFLHQPQHCRVTSRIAGTPSYQNYVIGFRVVEEIATPKENEP